jgi:putative ABC transport system permease protein
MRLLRQAMRMCWRDWRGGELRLLALALILAVAAVSSVGFFVDRVRLGLQRDAAQVLGGDAVLDADRPIDAAVVQSAQKDGLLIARTVAFPSMALRGDASVLVSVKAVSPGYPLRGAVQVYVDGVAREAQGIPERGTIWVDQDLLFALSAHPGDSLQLGNAKLDIARVIAVEPDRMMQVMGFAPRVLVNEDDLAATGLIQPASRVNYRLLVAGNSASVRAWTQGTRTSLQRGQRLESLEDGRPDVQRTLNRADRYLGLVTLVTVLIAAVAVSSCARRFTARRMDACALLRCIGLTQGEILALFAFEFIVTAVLASVAGVLAGFGLQEVLMNMLGRFLQERAPLPTIFPALEGLLCGVLLLLGFALPPLEQLRRVSPLRVLRRDVGVPGARMIIAYLAGLLGFAALLRWTAGDARLAAIAGGGFLACIAVFALLARVFLLGLRRLQHRDDWAFGVAWRFAVASMQRRPATSVAQLVALAVGLMALLLLSILRTDLIEEWRGQARIDAPNRFIINIQPDQVDAVRQRLQSEHVDATLEPMVRGRLVQIDGKAVGPESYPDERARNLVEREFNLSYRPDPPAHNEIVQGKWFAAGAPELSMEEGIAKRLDIHLGQHLRFDVGGDAVDATVTSLRKVNWDSMRVNFFVILEPALLRNAPQSYITSFYLPPGHEDLNAQLTRAFPNLTIIDVAAVLAQVRTMLDQIIMAAQFLFAFALAAGILVLYAALLSSHDERVREAALLRAMGASRRRLADAQTTEMVLVGVVAGLLASAGAAAIAWALAHFVFEFDFVAHAWVPLAGMAGGVLASLAGGWAGMRKVLATPPLAVLRDA